MESFCIEGGNPLRGEVTPSGNKNAALPLLCATILTDEPVILHNIPMIRDVLAMRRLIESLGVTFEEVDPHTWKIQAKNVEASRLDPDLCRRVRASILLAGLAVGGSTMMLNMDIPLEVCNIIEGIITLFMSAKMIRIAAGNMRRRKQAKGGEAA